jgi:hypothetical protein
MVQVPPFGKVLHVFPANEKGDGWIMVGDNEVSGPWLVTVTEEGVELVEPTSTLPKLSMRGLTVSWTGAGPSGPPGPPSVLLPPWPPRLPSFGLLLLPPQPAAVRIPTSPKQAT